MPIMTLNFNLGYITAVTPLETFPCMICSWSNNNYDRPVCFMFTIEYLKTSCCISDYSKIIGGLESFSLRNFVYLHCTAIQDQSSWCDMNTPIA